jgi:hypothetical protein
MQISSSGGAAFPPAPSSDGSSRQEFVWIAEVVTWIIEKEAPGLIAQRERDWLETPE